MGKPHTYLKDVDLDERSVTLTPATRRMSLVCKTETPAMNHEWIQKMEMSDEAKAALTAAMGELDKARAELGDYYDKIASAMAAAMSGEMDADKMKEAEDKAAALAEAAEKALKSLDSEAPAVGAAAEALAEALGKERTIKHVDDLPPHLQAQMDQLRKSAESAAAKIEKMQAEARRADLVAKCAASYKALPESPDVVADILGALDGDARKSAEALLQKMDGISEKSEAFKALGTGGAGATGSAYQALKSKASELRKSAPTLTSAQAMVEAMTQNPDLAAQYRAEQR